jgi:hypothetical protein
MSLPAVTYFISHCHKRDKSNAIATLTEVIRRLGYDIPIADTRLMTANWEAQVLFTGSLLRATINVYVAGAQPIVTEDELPHLDVIVNG